ncbi:ABC transporter permease [Sagittula stellata]|uniref:ABC transporter permease n=1 Tax=Sagittula stellata TaxID=52603 RepID=UPI00058D257A|nr:ABC transporter permease [Sagittula stellata]
MLRYTVLRILTLVPVFLVVSLIVFLINYLSPGDAVTALLGSDALSSDIEAAREELGLNEPFWVQYLSWLTAVLRGDFGYSLFLRTTVVDAILTKLVPTMQLAILSLIVTLLISIPLGTFAARYRGSALDQGVMGVTLIGQAVPSFVLGLLLILLFGVILRWLPVAGYVSFFTDPLDALRHFALPALSLGTILAALITRTTRAAVLDVLNSEYIDAARSRGVSENRLLFTHTLRNAGLPILTMVGLSFGTLVTGAVVTEAIFNIPGIGSLLVNAISRRDYAVIQGVVLFITVAYLLINLSIDLLYGLIDPRVRLSEKGR